MKKLNIAILCVHSCPVKKLGSIDTGGMNVYVKEVAKELGRRGHTVDVYTRAHDPKDKIVYSLGPTTRLIHIKAGRVEEMEKSTIYPHLLSFAYNMEQFRKRGNIHYDVIYSHYWMSGYVGNIVQQFWGIPHITMFHTLGKMKNMFSIDDKEPDYRIRIEEDVIQHCQHIIASTETEKNQLIYRYDAPSHRISVIPCGVNLNLFQPMNKVKARRHLQFPENEQVILFVGRIVPLKGIKNLFYALSYLRDIKYKLRIVGGDCGQFEKQLKRLSQRLHITKNIVFHGSVNHEELPYYYNAADVCVVPSYLESFCLVVLESLGCGTPVVATDVGCVRDVLQEGKTGYIIHENSPRHLAERISLLLSNASLNTHYLHTSVNDFTWVNIVDTILDEFHLTLEQLNQVVSHTTI